ncbi:hypothetical protein C8Q74DRAFT_1386303 [Fomes fomentarius]|nr:hypothetical protein C8Q74DRAFT_1386303 [Fomes fomentarius]
MRNVPDTTELLQEISLDPCGWCEREAGCITRLEQKGKSRKISSSCPYHYAAMSYTSATNPTPLTPCTNVPIHCDLCPEISHGQPALRRIFTHYADEDGNIPDIPPQMLVDMHISKREENEYMKITEEATDEWRNQW